jgi:hypothetical protein
MTTFPNTPAQKGDVAELEFLKTRYVRIVEAAFFRAERRRFAPGNEIGDWLDAVAEVDKALGYAAEGPADVRNCVRELMVGEVAGLSDRVRLLAVRALASRQLDADGVKAVVVEAVRGAEEGALQLGGRGRDALAEAVAGLERALSDVAEAGKLAVEEARGRATEFSEDELRKAIEELQVMKTLLGDTLCDGAANVSAFAQTTLRGLADHARIQGEQFARQIDEVLVNLGEHVLSTVRQRQQAGKQALEETRGALADLTSAALRAIADRLDRERVGKKE